MNEGKRDKRITVLQLKTPIFKNVRGRVKPTEARHYGKHRGTGREEKRRASTYDNLCYDFMHQ